MSQVGLNDLTMRAVATEAGLAKGTLYRYFLTKDVLVRTAIDSSLPPFVDRLCTLLDGASSYEKRLWRVTTEILEYFEGRRHLFRVFLHDRSLARQLPRTSRSRSYWALVFKMTSFLEKGIQERVFRTFDSKKIAALVVDAQLVTIERRLLEPHPDPVTVDVDALCAVLLNGMTRSSISRRVS